MSALLQSTRAEVVQALNEARARFERADAELKSFRFSYPATGEDFEKWKQLREIWEQRDEELQAAREALRDYDRASLMASSN